MVVNNSLSVVVWLVNKKEDTGGGTLRAILWIKESSNTPGPLGIGPTNPKGIRPHIDGQLGFFKAADATYFDSGSHGVLGEETR